MAKAIKLVINKNKLSNWLLLKILRASGKFKALDYGVNSLVSLIQGEMKREK